MKLITSLILLAILSFAACKKTETPKPEPEPKDPCENIYESYRAIVDSKGNPLWISKRSHPLSVVGGDIWIYAYRNCGLTAR